MNKTAILILVASSFLFSFNAAALKVNECHTDKCVNYFKSFKKAARRGYPEASLFLGKFFQKGYGTPINLSRALTYYKKAASKGILEAQFKTGFLLITNPETYDFDEGVKWLKKSANRGHPNGAFLLGQVYYDRKNFSIADQWLNKAYEMHQIDMPRWLSYAKKHSNFNIQNLPLLNEAMAAEPTVLNNDNEMQWSTANIEHIRISMPSLQSIFDSMLRDFRGKITSTGTRFSAIRCTDNVACQQKSLNEMKDSIWVSQH